MRNAILIMACFTCVLAMGKDQTASEKLSHRVLQAKVTCPEGITVAEIQKMEIPGGTVIDGSCFDCETPDTEVFPVDMTGVTFKNCNLNNVKVPPLNTVDKSCSTFRYKAGEDGQTYLIDKDDKPVKKLSESTKADEGAAQ